MKTATAQLVIRVWNKTDPLPDPLNEALVEHVAHVAQMLREGFIAGEICDDRFRGWWEIK